MLNITYTSRISFLVEFDIDRPASPSSHLAFSKCISLIHFAEITFNLEEIQKEVIEQRGRNITG